MMSVIVNNTIYLCVMLYSVTSCLCMVCVGRSDGVYEENCRAYTLCIDGQNKVVNCNIGQAFNTISKQCESKWNVPPPCGTYRECTGKHDGNYPDLETKCRSYFVCNNGMFSGHTLCPADLVYNVYQGVCDYTYAAPPPCGTNKTHIIG